jgi:hypothetical protein
VHALSFSASFLFLALYLFFHGKPLEHWALL